jgi:sarcosine oxidase delta subunit
MLMACPSCGKKFHSDFKLGGIGKAAPQEILITAFEMPCTVLRRILRFFSS